MSQPQDDPQRNPPPAYGRMPQPQGYVPRAPVPLSPSDERLWTMLAHLSPFLAAFVGVPFLGPLVVFSSSESAAPTCGRRAWSP